jgi:hypothetical protein
MIHPSKRTWSHSNYDWNKRNAFLVFCILCLFISKTLVVNLSTTVRNYQMQLWSIAEVFVDNIRNNDYWFSARKINMPELPASEFTFVVYQTSFCLTTKKDTTYTSQSLILVIHTVLNRLLKFYLAHHN